MKKRVFLGLSGGVDSSVAAYLLQKQGLQVEAVFMKNWDDADDGHCPAAQDLADAKAVAAQLDLPLHKISFSETYWEKVFQHFLQEYRQGRTPNPDVLCNKEIKFKAFLDFALDRGADYIATGHYARLGKTATNDTCLCKALDDSKDQSYFLHLLSGNVLDKVLFPLGNLTKSKVRQLAYEQGFVTHNKKDSTGICFIGERRFSTFLAQYLPAQPGEIIDLQGNLLGEHQGLMFHTIGQRQGLKIGGLSDKPGLPWFVVSKNVEKNQLVVAQGQDHPALYAKALSAVQAHWINAAPPLPYRAYAKIRYRQPDVRCTIYANPQEKAGLLIEFEQAQRAITPGQAIVFYQGDQCLGGATIDCAQACLQPLEKISASCF
jgi:tRNA-specific 2-thiouridylase